MEKKPKHASAKATAISYLTQLQNTSTKLWVWSRNEDC